jgi:hypothetical protein
VKILHSFVLKENNHIEKEYSDELSHDFPAYEKIMYFIWSKRFAENIIDISRNNTTS